MTDVLDACCGSRMFWFDKVDSRVTFLDKRSETVADPRGRSIIVVPDIIGDFTDLPFDEDTFWHVVFDPPHTFNGKDSAMAAKYGRLEPGWREQITDGFAECFRVLKPGGTLIFKWNEHRVPIATVLAMTPAKPLYGHRSGALAKTHWIAFMKEAAQEGGEAMGGWQMSLSGHQSARMKNDEWLTPPEILHALGPFDLDPCSPVNRPWVTARKHLTIEDDGLSRDWSGRVWLNPPFGREAVKWLRKMAGHGDGIALIPARTETAMFYETVWPCAQAVLFIKGRPHFHFVDGVRAEFNSGAPICLVAYGRGNAEALRASGLGITLNIKDQP